MSLLVFCHWLAKTHLGIIMRDSTWDFAIVEIGHLLALAVFGGAVLLVDLRLLDIGFRTQSTARVARELLPLTGGGVIVMFISGFLLVANGPVRYYYNPAFRLKMILFFAALFLHFILQMRVARQDPSPGKNSVWIKLGAVLSLLLWLSIGVAGRAIGYV
jgi:succinate dehydrogenase hydrophobic anchor subunit